MWKSESHTYFLENTTSRIDPGLSFVQRIFKRFCQYIINIIIGRSRFYINFWSQLHETVPFLTGIALIHVSWPPLKTLITEKIPNDGLIAAYEYSFDFIFPRNYQNLRSWKLALVLSNIFVGYICGIYSPIVRTSVIVYIKLVTSIDASIFSVLIDIGSLW